MKKITLISLLFSLLCVFAFAQEKDAFEEKQDEYFKEVKKSFPGLKNLKTAHFYLNYTSPTTEKYPSTMEGLFSLFKLVMSVKPDEAFFKGRLELYLWEKRDDYLRFAQEFEHFNAGSSGGYSTTTQMGWPRVNLPLETGIQGKEGNASRTMVVLFHEGTHAMFSQYLTDTPLPTWLNEGLAEYFAYKILEEYYPKLADSEGSKKRHVMFLKGQIQANKLRPFRTFFHQQGTSGGADYEAYALGWCLTSLLLKNYKVQTVQFIKKVKMSSEYRGPEIPKGPLTAKQVEEINKSLEGGQKAREKLLEGFFLECFKIDIDKFGENIYGQLKRSPNILDNL